MVNIEASYARELRLKNPLVAASAGTTETLDRMRKAEDAGFSAVVVKSLFEDPATRRDPSPMFRILVRSFGGWGSMTFYSYEQASHFDPDRYAEEISRAKSALEIPVIGSIACVSEEGWTSYARLIEEAGADAIELNLSCPYSVHVTGRLDVLESFVSDTVRMVKDAVSIPVVAKMTPQMTSPVKIAKAMEDSGADAVVPFSRFAGLDIDVEGERPIMHGGIAGHGGLWSIYYVLRWIAFIYRELSIPISGSGGAANGEDVVKHILAGASTVQICTAIYIGGYGVCRGMIGYLERYMERKGFESLSDFRGRASERLLSMHEVLRRQTVIAEISPGECSSCGICERRCPYGAIVHEGKVYRVRAELCTGCGLCRELCRAGAISLVPVPDGYTPRHFIAELDSGGRKG